ncbi:hypothetical protein LTR84_002053 [Exophiala bonariae]|uniref:DNA mismatch repair protein PMS1 n=1 Tax=Exophiala bonariae TaxID=1690606 RepID=A0AAV9NDV4_9EURO|nr:hypothetical protein LTR84_002053 [Exophiala bonariae]
MATIKAIEAKSVHQIQSGQVIVDLCSVAKELIENSFDADATSVEVRFKNYGLDSIEVQDNGSGIAPANYDSLALKHYTSKLSSYDDLSSLQTFGFRGEALSSLCALSKFSITTAQADEVPKGKHLDFDVMGRLKSTTIVASQRGTTASVEGLFESLPVRRKELAKNIKREYGKVLGLLHAYACISVNVKFTVKHAVSKGKTMTVFSTKGNSTTRENIANVYGTKTLSALVALDLNLEYQTTLTQVAHKEKHSNIQVRGHISRPVFGEGRQTPDRQMFFVNGRPCGIPQIAKAINEVYKSFNVSQSPFIFADFIMDTNAYDVNVSPDKRTILLHDSASLVDSLKTSLTEMFDQQDQTVPQSQFQLPKLPSFKKLNVPQQQTLDLFDKDSRDTPDSDRSVGRERSGSVGGEDDEDVIPKSLLRDQFRLITSTREEPDPGMDETRKAKMQVDRARKAQKIAKKLADDAEGDAEENKDDKGELKDGLQGKPEDADEDVIESLEEEDGASQTEAVRIHVKDFNARMAPQKARASIVDASMTPQDREQATSRITDHEDQDKPGLVTNAFDRMRPRRASAELATITIGDKTVTTFLGSQPAQSQSMAARKSNPYNGKTLATPTQNSMTSRSFSQALRRFGASGTNTVETDEAADSEDEVRRQESDTDSENEALSEEASENPGSVAGPEELDREYTTSANELNEQSDEDYIDEAEKRQLEEARVTELIRSAEESSRIPSKENMKRATKALDGGRAKDSITNLATTVEISISNISQQVARLSRLDTQLANKTRTSLFEKIEADPEERLSLTVAKADFAKMKIVGQFNLGFILAVRPQEPHGDESKRSNEDELFIIDQHASDEKYNFERLQATTVVGSQRLVRRVTLDLTAVEEEIVLENNEALEKNGFLVEIDTSGASMVGQRCRLVSLPLSKEVVFGIKDLDELIQLLAEAPGTGSSEVTRPSKVRKMFAMRACRSSIMIGKTLSWKQMQKVVAHMGTIDKPWNCPHGRPTMRHVCSLSKFEAWGEGEDEYGEERMSMGKALQNYVCGN